MSFLAINAEPEARACVRAWTRSYEWFPFRWHNKWEMSNHRLWLAESIAWPMRNDYLSMQTLFEFRRRSRLNILVRINFLLLANPCECCERSHSHHRQFGSHPRRRKPLFAYHSMDPFFVGHPCELSEFAFRFTRSRSVSIFNTVIPSHWFASYANVSAFDRSASGSAHPGSHRKFSHCLSAEMRHRAASICMLYANVHLLHKDKSHHKILIYSSFSCRERVCARIHYAMPLAQGNAESQALQLMHMQIMFTI